MSKVSVLIVEADALIADALVSLVSPHCNVVVVSPDGPTALRDIARLKPDVVVIDTALPGLSGVETAHRLTLELPQTKIVLVMRHLDPEYTCAAFRVGAFGYISYKSNGQELLLAIEHAAEGRKYVAPILEERFARSNDPLSFQPNRFVWNLTARQREVLQLVGNGKTVRQISEALNISPKTVEFHKNSLMNMTGLRTTADLIKYAITYGIVTV